MTERTALERQLSSEWTALLDDTEAGSDSGEDVLARPPGARRPSSRVALWVLLEDALGEWSRLRDSVDERVAARYINASWTLKDLLAHLASWATEFRAQFETVYRGNEFDYAIPFALSVLGPNEWNEEHVRARRERSLVEIFAEYERETRTLQNLLAEVDDALLYGRTELPMSPSGDPEGRLHAPPAMIVWGKCEHDRHHFHQIRERLKAFAND